MSHTYSNIWIHLIWATKGREPFLIDSIRKDLFIHIKDRAEKRGIYVDMINGRPDHVHTLVSIKPDKTISQIVNELKRRIISLGK